MALLTGISPNWNLSFYIVSSYDGLLLLEFLM
jgi:hypothetical protein